LSGALFFNHSKQFNLGEDWFMCDFTNTFRAFFPSSFRASGLAAALAFFVCLIAAPSALALTYTVTTNADSGAGSLRQAVLDANATADADVIVFNILAGSCPAGVCTITLASEITITNNGSLTINGTDARSLIIDARTNRIFFSNLAAFTLSGVTLTRGTGTGGALVFNGNGGAILVNGGTTTIRGVYFNANTGTFQGGGIYFNRGTNHRVENSTFSGNTAISSDGGGIYVRNTNLTVVNTTLTGNSAGDIGGGIHATGSGTLTLRGDTITANIANSGGGVARSSGGTLDFGNTIIAGNRADFAPEIFFSDDTATSRGYNLVGDSAGDSTATGRAITYQSTDIQNTPPLLDRLADYGGTTPTHRLQTGSPAIDKGNSFGLTTDQRGFARPVDNSGITNATGGDGSDIGAFEFQAFAMFVGGRILTTSGRAVRNAFVTLTNQTTGETRFALANPFGYYRFANVPTGQTYVFAVRHKRYTFTSQAVIINGERSDLNFTASP